MKILAIDAATNVAGVALMSEDKLICEDILDYELKHSQKLLPMIESVMKNSHLKYKDLDYLAVTIGPGSFTGLRIALATVKGIAQVTKHKIIPVSTLESLAYNLFYTNGIICPLLDARRDQVYTALFRNENNEIIRLTEDRAISIAELLEELKAYDEPVFFLGDGIGRYKEELKKVNNATIVAPFLRQCKPSSLAACAFNNIDKAQDLYSLEPSYLRASYAEEPKNKKSQSKK